MQNFESDDPDLYVNKVLYLLNQDVTDMDVYFVDEEYNSRGSLSKVIRALFTKLRRITFRCTKFCIFTLCSFRLSI